MNEKKSVMVVDDSATIRKIIQRELSKEDYEVILAKNGIEALSFLEWADHLPDLITLDIDMPRMNGFELCERIRAGIESDNEKKRYLARTPIVFVSANDSVENRERGYELEVIDFIVKPFSEGKVLSVVESILNSQEQFAGMSALVAEDSPHVRRVVCSILERQGLRVFGVCDGKEALKVIKRENFAIDIVITDYIMPGMSGEELSRTLRGFDLMEQVPVFFISSVSTKKEVLGFFRAGANDYLSKPFLEEEFRARVVTHLRNRKYVKELEELNAQLKYQADHDGLTGLYSRAFFSSYLVSAFGRSSLSGEELSCILLDLDFFKKVNDTYGHAFGDLVLKEFSALLQREGKRHGLAARYGGEEFVLLLPSITFADACKIGEQIRKKAEKHIYRDGAIEINVTISMGLAGVHEHGASNTDRLLIMADKALYSAKSLGRNQLVIYSQRE